MSDWTLHITLMVIELRFDALWFLFVVLSKEATFSASS